MAGIDVFGVHSGLGGHTPGAGKGPQVLKDAGALDWVGGGAAWHDIGHDEASRRRVVDHIARVSRTLAAGVERTVAAGRHALVLGGDHSCAIGTWSGAADALKGPLGLVWIDAHMDSHTPDTSHSGNYHGMPVAHLLGKGNRALVGIARVAPALLPDYLALVGVRSFEPEEPAFLDSLGVRTFGMTAIAARGLGAVLDEALSIAATGTAGYGISIDVDAIDARDVPGTGSPVAGGIPADDLIAALGGLAARPGLVGVEIAEFNPLLDRDGATLTVVRRLIEAIYRAAKER